jgi:tRNA A-37 threonylcarbamoyl transferase component Bud32
MLEFRWIHPGFRELVARHGWDNLPSVLALRGGQKMAPSRPHRDTLRLDVPDNGAVQTFYLKREPRVRWSYCLRHLLAGRGLWTPGRSEFEILCRLAAGGVACPRPVVCLQRLGWKPQSCLVLESLGSTVPLAEFLAQPFRRALPATRESFFADLGRDVARIHACGVHHPHLYADHAHVCPTPDGPRIAWLGFRRASLRASVSLAQRGRDIAALMATLPPRLASPDDQQAFYDGYLEQSDLQDCGTQLVKLVAQRVQQLLTDRKVWEIRESDTDTHRSVRPLESLEAGKMWVDRHYRPALERLGLTTFDAMMATTAGHLLRALPQRENWRLQLPATHTPQGDPAPAIGAYLKKHRTRSWRTWLRARLALGAGETPGRVEARNVTRLARSGIAAMRLIAYGEKLAADGCLQSFVLTEELAGYTQLDHFLPQHFPPQRAGRRTPRSRDLLRLIGEVAAVASKFHRLGYNHRDLYCCHFFIREHEPGRFHVNLIDLQRVEHRRHFRTRWLVKDLAQLSYSAPRQYISCTDKLAFIKHYLGVRKLRPQDKRFIRRILAKQWWMERALRHKQRRAAQTTDPSQCRAAVPTTDIPAPHSRSATASHR